MPCQRDGKPGFKYGESGHCYLIEEEGGEERAREKALAQGRAIEASKTEAAQQAILSRPVRLGGC